MKKSFFVLLFIVLVFIVYKVITKEESVNYEVGNRIDSHVNGVKKIIAGNSKYNKKYRIFYRHENTVRKKSFFLFMI